MEENSEVIVVPEPLAYKVLMEEEGLELKKMPLSIKNKIHGISALVGKLKNKPTQANKNAIIKLDIETCDLIQNYLEEGIPETKNQENMTKEEELLAAQKKQQEETEAAAAEALKQENLKKEQDALDAKKKQDELDVQNKKQEEEAIAARKRQEELELEARKKKEEENIFDFLD